MIHNCYGYMYEQDNINALHEMTQLTRSCVQQIVT